MKRLFALAGLVLAALVVPARAQSPDDQYVLIYSVIQEADALNNLDQPAQALPKFLEAQSALQRLQKQFPDWHEKVVGFRLNYLAVKIAAVTNKVTTATAAITTNAPSLPSARPLATTQALDKPAAASELENQLAALRDQVRLLQGDKALLEAKLKEALATQPAAVDPRELAKAQEKIQSLMKENDLLKASLAPEQTKAAPSGKALEDTKKALAEANRELAAQTERANTLAAEKRILQERVDGALSNDEASANLETTKKALAEATRKLAEQTESANKLARESEALQTSVRTLTASAEAADALRAENELLKKQVAGLKAAKPANASAGDAARQLGQAQAQIATLQSDAEILRLEKIALQNRVKQMNASPAPATVARSANLPEDAERIKQLERERDELAKKLEATNKELYGRKGRDAGARIDELSDEIAALRARLEVFETRAVPYTSEELALFKPPATQLAADPTAAKKPVRALPADARSLVVEAQRYFSAREFDKAEVKYLEILRQDDKNAYTLANLAAIQLELNHLDEAEKHVQQALAVSPDDGYSLSILGYLRFRQEKYDEAFDALSRAAKINPRSAEIQNYLGVTLSHKGLRGPAENALRKAIQLDPGYGSAHNNLAVIYATQPHPSIELSRWHYQKALAAGHARNAELEKMLDEKPAGGTAP
jgi:Flp pilus assembly protein TadD